MTRAKAGILTLVAVGQISVPSSLAAQSRVPIVDLPAATYRASDTLSAILGIKHVTGGMVLVNDAPRRIVRLYDSTLAHSTIVVDSASGTSQSYGAYAVPLISYLGDSSLLLDYQSRSLLMLDGRGKVSHSVALPNVDALSSFMRSGSGVDASGRLLYRNVPATGIMLRRPDANGASQSRITQPGDSAEIVRVDLDSRRLDTVGVVMQLQQKISAAQMPDGRMGLKMTINPLRVVDEWAVLSDGTIAFVRGHDYHVDWILPDGTKRSTEKLPFDWKRLTDDDKQKIVDSARAAENEKAAARAKAQAAAPNGTVDGMAAGGRGGGRGGAGGGGGDGGGQGAPRGPGAVFDLVPLGEMADYYPPIRDGAAIADLDGNLWVLPTTSAQSRNGELVYDVLNPKRGLFKRVRLPVGRMLVGFGKGGVVYTAVGTRGAGFVLEKSRLQVQ